MKRQILTLFLTLLILLSVGGIVSIVGAASHVNPEQASKPMVKAQSCPFVGNSATLCYHYSSCWHVPQIKPEHRVCFNTACDAEAAGYHPRKDCKPHC